MGPISCKFIIHRFVHQSARHERSGGLSTAQIHDFSARVFSDRYQNAHIPIFSLILVQNWGWDRGMGWVGLGLGWGSVWVLAGLYSYFKAAICLILASNTPPPHHMPGGEGGWGGVFEARIKQIAPLK